MNKSFYHLLISFLYLFLFNILVYADPPKWTYRFDTRSPDEIFQNGFSSWGNNDNIEQHIAGVSLGVSVGSQDSAWIATAARYPDIIQFMGVAMRSTVGYRTLWLYRIRATNNFYDMNVAMNNAAQNDPNPTTREHAATLLARFQYQNEWGALDYIPSTQIMEATQYRWNAEAGGVEPISELRRNTGYIDSNTHANRRTYPFHGAGGHTALANRMYAIGRDLLPTLMFAWCRGGISHRSETINSNSEGSCDAPDIMTFESFNQKVVWCASSNQSSCINKGFIFDPGNYSKSSRHVILHDEP